MHSGSRSRVAKGHLQVGFGSSMTKLEASTTSPVLPPKADIQPGMDLRRFGPILLQNSKVAGLQIFRKKTEREVIADSYNLNRITKVACEFVARR
jgi:hypothetical protein